MNALLKIGTCKSLRKTRICEIKLGYDKEEAFQLYHHVRKPSAVAALSMARQRPLIATSTRTSRHPLNWQSVANRFISIGFFSIDTSKSSSYLGFRFYRPTDSHRTAGAGFETENIRRALEATDGKLYGTDGAAELIGLKPPHWLQGQRSSSRDIKETRQEKVLVFSKTGARSASLPRNKS